MKKNRLARIILLLSGTTFCFPTLVENAPYCIYWKNTQIELPLRERGNIHLKDGKNIVFQFGTWSDANKTEYEGHYVTQIDSSAKEISSDSATKKTQPVYRSVLSYGGSGSKRLPNIKIKGIKVSDSTWIINEWFSREFESQFGGMVYRQRKMDKRQKEGYRWVCKEASSR
jgi:hypothetical protein